MRRVSGLNLICVSRFNFNSKESMKHMDYKPKCL